TGVGEAGGYQPRPVEADGVVVAQQDSLDPAPVADQHGVLAVELGHEPEAEAGQRHFAHDAGDVVEGGEGRRRRGGVVAAGGVEIPTGSFTSTPPISPGPPVPDPAPPAAGTSVRVEDVGRNAPRPLATGTQTPRRHSAANSSGSTWACCHGWTGNTTWSGPSTPAP